MKKLIILFTLLFNLSNIVFCQHLQIDWQQCFGGSENDVAYDIFPSDNGYMIVGYTRSNDGDISFYHGGPNDVWLVKTDSIGNMLWEKTYGGSGSESADRIFQSGNALNYFIIAGTVSSDGDISFDPYPNSLDYWIMKIDSNGSILWDKIVGGNGWDYSLTGTATDDGGIVALGWTSSSDGDISNYYGAYDMWLIKLNSNGDTEWDFSIGTSGFDYGQAIIQTSDGGYLIGGTSRLSEGGNLDCEPYSWKAEAILFKLDANGNEEWQQCYGGSGDEGVNGLLELEDGYIFTGLGDSYDGDLSGSGYHGEGDIWIMKIDFSGNIIWQKCFGGSNYEYANKIFQTSDGGFMVFGNTQSFDGDVSGNHSLDETRYSIWVFKIDDQGNLLWQQCIGGIANEEVHFGVIKKSDNNYAIAGKMLYSPSFDVDCSNHVNNGYSDYWIFEVSDTTVHVNKILQTTDLKAYPNPANSMLSVDIPDNYNIENTQLEIINITGKTVLKLDLSSHSVQLDISQLKSGLFLIKVENDKTFNTKRVIINK